MTKTEAIKFRKIIEQAVQSLTDEVALEATTLFPEWEVGVKYSVGIKIKYNDVLYKVITEHTTQETWTPDVSPSLFAVVLIPDENVIPEWVQPESTNPYKMGDKVVHNGITYESLVDNNTWEPGVVGTESLWKVITE